MYHKRALIACATLVCISFTACQKDHVCACSLVSTTYPFGTPPAAISIDSVIHGTKHVASRKCGIVETYYIKRGYTAICALR